MQPSSCADLCFAAAAVAAAALLKNCLLLLQVDQVRCQGAEGLLKNGWGQIAPRMCDRSPQLIKGAGGR